MKENTQAVQVYIVNQILFSKQHATWNQIHLTQYTKAKQVMGNCICSKHVTMYYMVVGLSNDFWLRAKSLHTFQTAPASMFEIQ